MGKPIAGSNPALSATHPGSLPPFPGARYHSLAVLGGELAVPCTCKPLQQG